MVMLPYGAAALNLELAGRPGSRAQLETPAALLDLDLFESNIALLADTCRRHGIGVRPHAKSHKCAEIARRQIAAGALGVCCAKPGELIALFEAGINDLCLTAPVASTRKIDALAQAARRGARIMVVADRPDLVAAYAQAADRNGTRLDVLVDLDTGLNRTGVDLPEAAVALAREIRSYPALNYAGVQAYNGRVQHVDGFSDRRAANRACNRILQSFVTALRHASLAPRIISGGGTGTTLVDGEEAMVTEIQAGSYVAMDETYRSVDVFGADRPGFAFALRIAVTVVGHSSAGFAIVDGGSKSFGIDGPPPYVLLGGRQIGRIEWCGDEFGRILPAPAEATVPIGTVVECTVPHCDPTINLHDFLHIVAADQLLTLWRIDARGRAD
jgi:D-serine deaminase-like pyridoxal phosphate-dependent protein